MIFRMGVPFPKIADSSLTRSPSRQGDIFMAKRQPLEQVAKPFVPYRWYRRLLNKHMLPMHRTEQ